MGACLRSSVVLVVLSLLPSAGTAGDGVYQEALEAPIDQIVPDLTGAALDCNRNGVDDQVEYDRKTASDSDDDGLLDECELVRGDVDLDRDVDETDGALLSAAVGSTEGVDRRFSFGADVNQDHVVDSVDVMIWGRYYREAHGVALECSDHADNDGDGRTDFPSDPGCADVAGRSERAEPVKKPQCSDRRDNDGDGTADHDGGGAVLPDPDCTGPGDDREATRGLVTDACPEQARDWTPEELRRLARAAVGSSEPGVQATAIFQDGCRISLHVYHAGREQVVWLSALDGAVVEIRELD
jgi:hypothetical protein